MTLHVIKKSFGQGGAGLDGHLGKVLVQLQARKTMVATGAAAATNIALAGIAVGDTVIGVINMTDFTNVDVTTVSISAAGFIQVSTDTSAKHLLVDWAPKGV